MPFARYTTARVSKSVERYMLELYLTDGIKAINSTLAQAFGGEELEKRWYDYMHPVAQEKSATEIIESIKEGLREL